MLNLQNCPYVNCSQDILTESTEVCPKCNNDLIWCNLCGSPNLISATYCRACGGGKDRQNLPIEDWRMIKGNSQLTSATTYHCNYPKSREMIKLLWVQRLEKEIMAPAISAYGNLICLSRDGELFFLKEGDGSLTGLLTKLDGESTISPAVDGGDLYIASSRNLAAYDFKSKSENWRYSIPEEKGLFATDLVTYAGYVIICCYCDNSDQGTVLGFRKARSKPLWSLPIKGKGLISTPVVIGGNQLMIGREDGSIFHLELDPNQGPPTVLWEAIAPDGIPGGINTLAAPAYIQKGIYLVNEDNELYRVSIGNTGMSFDKILNLQVFVYGLSVSDSYICIADNRGLTILDKNNFQKQWDTQEKEEVGEISSPPVISGKMAFAASINGKAFFCSLTANRPEYQAVKFSEHYQRRVYTLASHKNFYIVTDSGEITALSLKYNEK